MAPVAPIIASLIEELRRIVGAEHVHTSPGARMAYECDGYTIEKASPEAVVLPANAAEVTAVVRACRAHGSRFVSRGAGTSLAGGTIPVDGAVMIGLARLNRILHVDTRNRFAIVEPGVVNVHLTNRLKGTGLHYAPDPSSQGACTIGGNAATNSGGPHTLKYGVTVNHVLGLEMVLPCGEVVQLGGPTEELAGYDLVGLAVGSEGTFGIVTKVWVRLTPDPQAVRTQLAIFESVEATSEAISAIIAAGIVPAALEMMDSAITAAVEDAFHFGFPRDAGAILIIEVDGLEAGLEGTAVRIAEIARQHGAREVRLAGNEEERALLWKSRKKAFGAVGRLSPNYCCQDGVVPRSKIPNIMRFIVATAERHAIRIVNVFHAGDGNIHPILLFDERDEAQLDRVIDASHDILNECVRLGGSVTGEHGIGVEKIEFLTSLFSVASIDEMKRIRDVFNPDEFCNRYKLLPHPDFKGRFGLRTNRMCS